MSRNLVRAWLASIAMALALGGGSALGMGEFTHAFPISIPAGVQGMQPSLSLTYSSEADNDIVGVGWGLSGLPAITRVSFGNGINYEGRDDYLHTSLGLLVAQADGSYRTKVESFHRFVPQGVCGEGPCSWTEYEPSGMQGLYGTTSDAKLPRGTSVRMWHSVGVLIRLETSTPPNIRQPLVTCTR